MEDRLNKLLGYLESDPENFALLSDTGDLCLQLGHWQRARPLLEKALTLQPNDPGANYRMAVALYHLKEAETSLVLTQKLLDAGVQHAQVRYQHVLGLVRLGRFVEAKPILAALLEEKAELPTLPHLYIRTLQYLGELEEAANFAAAYVQGNPQDVTASGMLSLIYLDQEKFAEADKTAQQVLAVSPDNLDALVTAGSTAMALERYEEARRLFERSVEVSPGEGRARLGLGLADMLKGDLPAAAKELEKAVESMPGHLGSWNTLAWVHILQRDFDAAERVLEKCLEINRNFGETHGGLAVIAAMKGEWGKAKTLTEKALRLQPESFAGRFAQSLLIAQRGRPQQASEMVDAILNSFTVPGGGNLSELIRRFVSRK